MCHMRGRLEDVAHVCSCTLSGGRASSSTLQSIRHGGHVWCAIFRGVAVSEKRKRHTGGGLVWG